jgi:PPK2 family polyphosphate:nucleotide phosphotransferase
MGKKPLGPVSAMLRVPPGPVDLSSFDPAGTPGFLGSRESAEADVASLSGSLADLQERLFAHGRSGGHRSLLLVVQGMDTAGKGGVMRNVAGLLDPQGVHIKAFAAPTPKELRHDFLWRIEKQVPAAGRIGIFDRSHYEDVLVGPVRRLAPAAEIERRYEAINEFERRLVDTGTTIIKVMLHISYKEQYRRLTARLDDPTKHWKFNPGDTDDRLVWDDYRAAYEVLLDRCNTADAPWYVVPTDHKWYRTWAVTHLLHEHLAAFNLGWPKAGFDVEEERKRLDALK